MADRMNERATAGTLPWTRRQALLAVGGLTLATTLGRPTAAAPALSDRSFAVHRKGQRIGTHAVRFENAGAVQRVTTEVDLAVKVAFVTAFRYRQTAVDNWRDGVFVGGEAETDDDGDRSRVVCGVEDGELKVAGPKGDYAVDLGTMTDLSFWNLDVTRQEHLIDAKDGDLTKVRTANGVAETVELGGQAVAARRFEIVVSPKRSGKIWFDADGAWVKALLKTRGEVLDYRLIV